MAALTKDRDTQRLGDTATLTLVGLLIGASTKLYKGGIVAVNAAGYAVIGSATTGLKAAGVAQKTYDNSSGADGAFGVEARAGVFLMDNYGTDPVVQGDVGANCYIYDDHTVRHTSTGMSVAGIVTQLIGTQIAVRISLT